jgi:hypothetical protein
MSVKSRAQLIVWCLPHLGFVDNEPAQPVRQEIPAGASAINTMPVGSTTVSGSMAAPIRTDVGTGSNTGGTGDVIIDTLGAIANATYDITAVFRMG